MASKYGTSRNSPFSDSIPEEPMLKPSTIIKLALSAVALIVLSISSFGLFEYMDASEYMVIQSPLSGDLAWHTGGGGMKWQGFGKVTKFHRSAQYEFEMPADEASVGNAVKIRFNDGGEAHISGSVRYELAPDEVLLTKLYQKFRTQDGVENSLVRPIVHRSVYMSGPLMSSAESFSKRRNDLISYIVDQAQHGVYRTVSTEEKTIDELSGESKTVTRVDRVTDPKAPEGFARQEISPSAEFGLKFFNLSISRMPYNERVEKQIEAQQNATMAIQTAIAEAKKAQQKTITVEEEGKASAAAAKWEQETIRAKEVTRAEQERDVAVLTKEKAEYLKAAAILEGQGEAEKRRLIMSADGALEKKLETYKDVNALWANAFQQFAANGGRMVPEIVMGGSAGNASAGSNAQAILDLITTKTAKDLSLDMKTDKK